MYLYPENLTARPMLWLWTLRDVAFIGIGLLLSVLALTQARSEERRVGKECRL